MRNLTSAEAPISLRSLTQETDGVGVDDLADRHVGPCNA
jgi:hypothetical protein